MVICSIGLPSVPVEGCLLLEIKIQFELDVCNKKKERYMSGGNEEIYKSVNRTRGIRYDSRTKECPRL